MIRWQWLRESSIRRQLIVTVALVHAVLMTVFVTDLVVRQRAFLHDEHVVRSSRLAEGLARQVSSAVMAGDLVAQQEAVSALRAYPDLNYAFIVDRAGHVLAHTDAARIGQYIADSASLSTLRQGERTRVVVDTAQAVDVITPVQWQGRTIGWIRFGTSLRSVDSGLRNVVRTGLGFAALAIALGTLLAWWTANRLTRRLHALLRVADATRDGRRDLRAQPSSVYEIRRLSESFNGMLDALSTHEIALAQANDELEARIHDRTGELAESVATTRAILEQANDAFISIDAGARVVEWNAMAETTFGWSRDEAMGCPLTELIIPAQQHVAHQRGMQHYLATGEGTVVGKRVELMARTRAGHEIPVEMSTRARHRGAQLYFDAFLRDISKRRALEASLEQQALQDALTGLPNRRSLLDMLPRAMQRSDRSGKALALLFLDLDGFKQVNDTLGHHAGDRVLQEFARRARGSVRSVDEVARLAGDEFVVVAESLNTPLTDAYKVAAKIQRACEAPFELDDGFQRLSVSIGIALYEPASGVDPGTLLLRADRAMYRSKGAGRSLSTLWKPEVHGTR